MTKKTIIKITFFSFIFLIAGFTIADFVLADGCPANTEVGETQATLVGEVTDDGGDPNLEVWLQYGKSAVLGYAFESVHSSQYGLGSFCAVVYNLEPCTTYHYRAVAKNSAGTSYGENKTFTTKCSPLVTVDIKANNSNGPIILYYRDFVTLFWTSQNASFCEASGDWSGSKAIFGSELIQLNFVKTYKFNITCKNADASKTATDSVEVRLLTKPPVVITKPAIVTY